MFITKLKFIKKTLNSNIVYERNVFLSGVEKYMLSIHHNSFLIEFHNFKNLKREKYITHPQ